MLVELGECFRSFQHTLAIVNWASLQRTFHAGVPNTHLWVYVKATRWGSTPGYIVKPLIGIIDITVKSITLKVGLFLFYQSV